MTPAQRCLLTLASIPHTRHRTVHAYAVRSLLDFLAASGEKEILAAYRSAIGKAELPEWVGVKRKEKI